MLCFVTFVKNGEYDLEIFNGLSFVLPFFNSDYVEHIFIDLNEPLELTTDFFWRFEKVFCSLNHCEEYLKILPCLSSNWIIGGALVNEVSKEFFWQKFKCVCVTTSFEHWIKKPISSKFLDYWSDKPEILKYKKPISYMTPIGKGCYWSKCEFCSYHHFEKGEHYIRNIDLVFSGVREFEYGTNILYLGLSATPVSALMSIFNNLPSFKKRVGFNKISLYLRADNFILDFAKKQDDWSSFICAIGLESFSQEVVDAYSKGIKIKDVYKLSKLLIAKGATVALHLMDLHPIMRKEFLDDALQNIDMFASLKQSDGIGPGMFLYNNGPTYWPANDIDVLFGVRNLIVEEKNIVFSQHKWVFAPNENHEAFKLNRIIAQHIKSSGIFVHPEGELL